MENLERDMYGDDDDVGYYDYDENDDWCTNAADGAFCPEALNSCWDKSGWCTWQHWDRNLPLHLFRLQNKNVKLHNTTDPA